MAIDTVRSMKLLVSRMGPFDDSRIAETGFFVAGQASALAKLKKIVEGKAAKVGIPILVSEHGVKPAAGSVAEALDHATGEMLEGGPGSGHFSHKGRKGHLGGSLPGAARLAGDVKLSSIYVRGEEGGFDALLSRFPKLGKAWREAHAAGNGQNAVVALQTAEANRLLKPYGVSVANIVSTYTAQGVAGVGTMLEVRVETGGDGKAIGVKVMAYFHDAAGHGVGDLTRTISLDAKKVSHDSFSLDEKYQGRGIAATVNRKSFDLYRRMGLKEVEIFANGSVGGYAWALQGFDFTSGHNAQSYIDSAIRRHMRTGLVGKGLLGDQKALAQIDTIVGQLKHSWDYARLRVDGEKIGKKALIGASWLGSFDLARGSASEKVFNHYLSETRKKLGRRV